jgi:soluble lytic murein transglycosylase-like protein
VKKWLWRQFRKRPFWQQALVIIMAPLVLLNLAVGFFGNSLVSPFSPFFVREKCQALTAYALHRPFCVLSGHEDLETLAEAAGKKYGLPKGLMRAVVEVESGSNAHRISAAGAMGPAQLMPGTAKRYGVHDAFDPAEALDASARFLSEQLKRTGKVELAVASYNAGPGNVHGSVPQNGETEFYVAKVMRAYRR